MTDRLLDYLGQHANRHGLVLASETRLLRDLRVSRAEADEGLEKLASTGVIKILAPLPFLVAKFPSFWSSSSSPIVENKQQISSNPVPKRIEVPVSSRAAVATQQEDGGAGEGETLLDQVLAALGPEADRDEFRAILAGRDPALIHRALRRVQATKNIRVSRAALFRALLRKLSY